MHLFINSKQKTKRKKKQQTRTNITKSNWVLMPFPSTVALQLCERLWTASSCSQRALFPRGAAAAAPQSARLSRLSEAVLTLRQCRGTQRIQKDSQKSRSNSLSLSFMLSGCSAAGQWGRQDVKTTNYHQHEAVFFTLYILSIFTHKMYMIGMHIIFLLTDSFNKALCQSAATCWLCLLCAVWNPLDSRLGSKVGNETKPKSLSRGKSSFLFQKHTHDDGILMVWTQRLRFDPQLASGGKMPQNELKF